MANNYTQSSSQLLIPKDKHAQAQEIIDRFMSDFDEEQDEYCDIKVELEADGVWIHGDESFDPEQAAELLQWLVDGLEIDEPFAFSWSYTCSKMRLDEFGGGACLVRRGQDAVFIDARSYIDQIIVDQKEQEPPEISYRLGHAETCPSIARAGRIAPCTCAGGDYVASGRGPRQLGAYDG